jgi:hypothetical protein
MPSSYSTSLRFELQFAGENLNLWGDKLNAALSRADEAIAGWATISLTGPLTLSTANGGADQARLAMLKFTGTGAFTVTVPAVSKAYDVWNGCAGALTLTNGSASVTLQPGEVVRVVTDGGASFARVQATDFANASLTSVASMTGLSLPTTDTQAASKKYVDDTAFAMTGGSLPGQAGKSGYALTTNGAVANWGNSFTGWTLTTPIISAPTITGGATLSGTLSGGLTLTGGMTLSDGLTFTGSTKQNVSAMASLDIDVSAGEWFTKSISSNSIFTFSNPTASKAQGFVLDLTISSAATTTWPAAVKWSLGTAPVLGNGRHLIGFVTDDGGTTYVGIVGARAVA